MWPTRSAALRLRKATLLSTAALLAGLLPAGLAPARAQTISPSSCPSGVDATTCFAGAHTNAYISETNTGGTGSTSSSFDIYTSADITIVNDLSIQNPINIRTQGGAGDSEVGESGAAGNAGGAGSVHLENDGELDWSGTQTGTAGDTEIELIYIVADGGEGGHPDEHGDGGVGGNGGFIEVTNNANLQASGSFASGVQAIHAFAAGGNGGPGNDSSINHHGGNGGAGGTIDQIQNNAQILLGTLDQSITGNNNAIAIYATSRGGNGGANGYSNGGGSHSGNGGGGAAVVVENNDDIVINWVPFSDGNADELVGIKAVSQGGNGANSAHNFESGGLGGSSGNVTVQNYADITILSSDPALAKGGGIVVQSLGGTGGNGQKQGDSESDGVAGSGGGAADVWVYHNADASISTQGNELPGILAISRGGAGGSGASGFDEDNSSGGPGGGGGATTIGLTGSASIHTTGDLSPGVLAQGIGGYGGDGGTDGGLVGEGGGAGEGGDGGEIDLSSESGTVIETEGDFSYGMAAQSIGGGGGTGGDFYGVLGGAGGDGGRGGDAKTAQVTAAGRITTSGDHSYAVLAQSIAGGGGAGGIAVGVVSLGGDGGAGGTGGSVTVTNEAQLVTQGYAAHAILAQSIAGGGGAAGMAGGVLAIGGDGAQSYTANGGTVTVHQSGNIVTAGHAATAIVAQSIGGGGGSGAGADGIAAVGGTGSAGGSGGAVNVTLTGEVGVSGAIETVGNYAHGLLAQSIGGGGGNGGDVLDFAVGVPSLGIGGSADGGGEGGAVTVSFDSFIFTQGDHATGILAQSLGGGGGNGGDATGLGGLTLAQLTIGGDAGGGGAGKAVAITGLSGNLGVVTYGSYSHGVVGQSIGGGGGNGGNAYGFDASLNFAAQVAIGGQGGSGGGGGDVTLDWQGDIATGGNLFAPPEGQPLAITDQATNAYAILVQSIGGGGGNGGSATVDQFVVSIPDGDIPIPTITLGAAVGATGGSGGSGGSVDVTLANATVSTFGAGSHAILLQSIGGGGGTGGDGTALGISAAIPDTTELPAITLDFALGGSGGVAGVGGEVSLLVDASTSDVTIATFGDNANAIVAQSIGGGGGDAGAGNASTFAPGQAHSFSAAFGLGGLGSGGGTGGTIEIAMAGTPVIQTVGSGSRGIVAQSIGGGGGTSQGGTGALYAGSFVGVVQVGRPGGGGGDAGDSVTVNSTANIMTNGGDADGILAQSIGGGGGLGGTFGADGSLDDPNWIDFILDVKHEIDSIAGEASYSTTVTVGGAGGTGGNGKTATVANGGSINTVGDWADGMVVQSIGGGGGVGGLAVSDGSQQTVSANVGVGGKGGGGGDGGEVYVNDVGTIATQGYAAYGLLAQSIGGGGGQGGDGSTKATGTITVGSGAGGGGGTGGNGNDVEILAGGTITTLGDDAHALVAQSIGGGGGVGGSGNSLSAPLFEDRAFDIVVGGGGGSSGSGDRVVIYLEEPSDNFQISTGGARSFGIVAQSIGGGGGIGGAGTAASIASLVLGGSGGGTVNGDEVYIDINASVILTSGLGAHAIVAQSIGGGGGIGGDASGAPLSFGGNSPGSYGNGGPVTVSTEGTIVTTGDYAHGIVAQSLAGGGGLGGDQNGAFAGSNGNLDSAGTTAGVVVLLGGILQTQGKNSIGIFAQSDSGQTNGAVEITVAGAVSGGSGTQGAGVHVDEGSSGNDLTIEEGGSVTALSGNAIVYTGGAKLNVDNEGAVQANVDLRNDFDGLGLFSNKGRLFAGTLIDAELENRGLFVVGLGNGALETTRVGGSFTQFAEGELRIDADLASNVADVVEVKGQAALDGAMTFNFLNLLPGGEALVLTADGGVTGALTPAGSGIFDFALTQQGNEVHLSVGGAAFQTDGLPGSQAAVAEHLQTIWDAGGNDDFGPVFASIENAAAGGSYTDALAISPLASRWHRPRAAARRRRSSPTRC